MTYATLWDWRTRVHAIYAQARANPDPHAAWRQWRAARDTLFRHHPQTPLENPASFKTLPFYPHDPTLRFTLPLTPHTAPDLLLEAGEDGQIQARPFARTAGLATRLGAELTLYWLQGYGGGVFLPFTDATSGQKTYGGGRYLLDTIKGADLGAPPGHAVLDFNFAYNPSCAYSSRYLCPLSPPENRLPSPVQAGERHPPSLL